MSFADGGMAMIRHLRKLLRDVRGGTAIEYGLIIALVVIVMFGALVSLAGTTQDMWDNVSSNIVEAGH